MKHMAWLVGALVGAVVMMSLREVYPDAHAQGANSFRECTVLAAKAGSTRGPKWSKNHQGSTQIPGGWSVVSGLGNDLPGILVCR